MRFSCISELDITNAIKNRYGAYMENSIKSVVLINDEEEDFIIRNTDLIVNFRQPSVSDNKQYTWSVTLCKGNYSIFMTDSSSGWSSGSNVVIKAGSTTIGSFTCSSSSASFSFTV